MVHVQTYKEYNRIQYNIIWITVFMLKYGFISIFPNKSDEFEKYQIGIFERIWIICWYKHWKENRILIYTTIKNYKQIYPISMRDPVTQPE